MKKICLFSTKVTKGIEGEEAELYVNFYLVLNRNYIFTFLKYIIKRRLLKGLNIRQVPKTALPEMNRRARRR